MDLALSVYLHVIEGDGTGVDITPVMRAVVDAAVEKAFGGKRRIVRTRSRCSRPRTAPRRNMRARTRSIRHR